MVNISDNGMNDGFTYFNDVPVITITYPQVNTNALNDTSGFYKIQEKTQKTRGGVTYCGRSSVTGIIPLVERHEGYQPDLESQKYSHAAIFRHHVDSLAFRVFEPIAGPFDSPLADQQRAALFEEAYNDSKAMDTDSRNYINSVTLPCTFKFDYSGLH